MTAAAEDPSDGSANALRLACLYELGKVDDVLPALEAHAQESEDSVLYVLAYIALDLQRYELAERYLRRHNVLDDSHAECWEMLGRAMVLAAQDELRRTAASPYWIPASLRPRIEEAETYFSRAQELLATWEIRTELKFVLVNRGVARTLLGRSEDARQDYEQALRIDPSAQEVMRNLGSLHLNAGRSEEAIRHFEQVTSPNLAREVAPMLAAAYLNQNKPTVARGLLEPLADSQHPDDPLIVTELLLIACQRLNDVSACKELLISLGSHPEDPDAHRITADYHAREGNFDEALKSAQLALQKAGDKRTARYRLVLGDILYQANRFDEAADAYALVPVPADKSAASRRHLTALYNAGRFRRALQVAQAVRNGGPAIPEFSELEALIYESLGDLDSADRLRTELLTSGVDPSRQKLKLASNHFRRGRRDEAVRLALEVDLGSIQEDSESLWEAARLRTLLEMPDALEFAWRLLTAEPSDPSVHLFYVNAFFRREEVDKLLFHPETIAGDCVVTLRAGAETHTLTLVRGGGETGRNLFSIEHAFAKALLGKRTGEKVRYPAGELSELEYEILAVQSKFVQAFQDCMARFNERFPTHYGLTRLRVENDDITHVVVMLEHQRAHTERILDHYGRRQLPACTAARLFGKSDFEMFRALVEDRRIKVWSFDGRRGRSIKESAALDAATSVILETSALVTLQSIGLLSRFRGAFGTIYVTQLQMDSLADTIANLLPEKQSGRLFSDSPGHIQVMERTSSEVIREKTFYCELRDFMQSHCHVAASTGIEEREDLSSADLRRMVGDLALATLSAATLRGSLVLSDDLPFRILASNSYSIASVGTLTLLGHLQKRSVISESEYHAAIQWLVEKGYSFVSVEKADIIWVLRKNGWSPTPEVAKFLDVLCEPDCDVADVITVGLQVLRALWEEPLPAATQELVSDLVLRVLVTGRPRDHVLDALEVANRERSLIWTPATGHIRRVIQSWRAERVR